MAKFCDRTEEMRVANNGQKMYIHKYYSAKRIDVRFEDGTIVENRTYTQFKNGCIKNPNFQTMHGVSLNEIILLYYFSKFGFYKKTKKKEIEYGKYEYDLFNKDLMLAIEYDGDPRTHTTFKDKRKNKDAASCGVTIYRVRTPEVPKLVAKENKIFLLKNTKPFSKDFEELIINLTNEINTCFGTGFKIDIDLKRDKDKILEFIKEKYCIDCNKYIGQTNTAKNGQKMKIVKFYTLSNLTVQFEDKTIVEDQTYEHFKTGSIGNPNYTLQEQISDNHVEEEKIANNGMKMKIIKYRNYLDIDIQFQDGAITRHRKYEEFKKGKIGHPSSLRSRAKTVNLKNCPKNERKDEANIMNNGQKAKIIEYFTNKNITVEFEDGTVVKNKKYSRFLEGSIGNPNFKKQ